MSATTVDPTLDLTGSKPIPVTRLLAVELRKMIDTRAGKWLLGIIVLLTAVVLVIFYFNATERSFINSIQAAATPQGVLLPVLGIMLITQEWGQRTGMVTFTLEPHRAKVLGVKVGAAIVFGLIAVAFSFALAALTTVIANDPHAWAGVDLTTIVQYILLQLLDIIGGLVFGLLFLNTAAAIVTSFALPIGFSIVTSLWHAAHKVQGWLDPGTAQAPLQNGDHLTSHEWRDLAINALIWVVLPFVIGMWRVLRAELK
jgi:ABC-type transport system involved in multi-copper enzyme maturation permease subunit